MPGISPFYQQLQPWRSFYLPRLIVQMALLNLPDAFPQVGAQMHPVHCQYRGHTSPVKFSRPSLLRVCAVAVAEQEVPARGRSEWFTRAEKEERSVYRSAMTPIVSRCSDLTGVSLWPDQRHYTNSPSHVHRPVVENRNIVPVTIQCILSLILYQSRQCSFRSYWAFDSGGFLTAKPFWKMPSSNERG